MSFGFSVGDIIAVARIADQLRNRIQNAPKQHQEISKELQSLHAVLGNTQQALAQRPLRPSQEENLKVITSGCREVLESLKGTLDRNDPNDQGKSKIIRYLRRSRWDPKTIDDFRQRLTFHIALLSTFLNQLNSETIDELKAHNVAEERRQKFERVVSWFSDTDYADQQIDFVSRRQGRTGEWFLNSSDYQRWLGNPGDILLCEGTPGVGKTIMASLVIDSIQKSCRSDHGTAVAFLYLSYQPQKQQKIADLVGCLTRQLIQTSESIPTDIEILFDIHDRNKTRPSLTELIDALEAAITDRSRVFIVIDALDEYHDYAPSDMDSFLSALLHLHQQCPFSLLATSRPIPDISTHFSGSLSRVIKAHDEDIKLYIGRKISSLLQRNIDRHPELREIIIQKVLDAADGMFLHAELLMEFLNQKLTPGDLKEALADLPHGQLGLEKLYDQAMSRIRSQPNDLRTLALKTLTWLTHSQVALSSAALLDALTIRPGTTYLDPDFAPSIESIISACAGLITFDEQSRYLRLVHKTTEEYFEPRLQEFFPDGHGLLTEACITYLSLYQFAAYESTGLDYVEYGSLSRQNALFPYAAVYWAQHAKRAQNISDCILSFLHESSASLSTCMQAILFQDTEIFCANLRSVAGVHLAAYLGLEEMLKTLISKGPSPEAQDSYGRTPLWYACRGQQQQIVRLLLSEYNVDPNHQGENCHPILYSAAHDGSTQIVEELLRSPRIDTSVQGPFGLTPLAEARIKMYADIIALLSTHDGIALQERR